MPWIITQEYIWIYGIYMYECVYIYICNTFLKFLFIIYIFIVVQVQLSPFSPHLVPPPHPSPPYTLEFTPLALSMCPLYIFLDGPSHFSSIIPFPSPLWLLSVCSLIHFLVIFCLFVLSIRSTYRWDHMVFVFHVLAYLTQHNALHIYPCCQEG